MVSCQPRLELPRGMTGRCPGLPRGSTHPAWPAHHPCPLLLRGLPSPLSSPACLLLTRPSVPVAPLPVLARCFGLDRWDGERRSHAEVAAELQQPIEYVTRTEVRALRKLRGRRGLSDLLEARGLMR